MSGLLAVALALTALPAAPRAGDGDKALRDAVEHFFQAYAAKDLDASMSLWSEKSPGYEARKQDTARLFDETGPIRVKSLTVGWVRRDADAASVRARVELTGNDAKTGNPHPLLGKLDGVLDLVREGGGWKLMRSARPGPWLIERLAETKSKAERLRFLDDNSDLIGPDFVQTVLDEENLSERWQFDRAIILLDVAGQVAEGLGERDAPAWRHVYRGRALELRSRYGPALASYQTALALFHGTNNREGEGRALSNIGNIFDATAHFAEALQAFQDSLAIERDLADRKGEAATLGKIGTVFGATGRYVEALQLFQDGLKIQRDLNDRFGEAQTLNNFGNFYEKTSRYADALRLFQDSLKIERELEDRAGEALTLNNMGIVYADMNRRAEALQYYQDSLAITHDLGNRAAEAATLGNIGNAFRESRRYADALRHFQDSLKIKRELGDRVGEAETLNNIGVVYDDTDRSAEALWQYHDSLAIARDLGNRAMEAATLNNIGNVLKATRRYAEALRRYQDSLTIERDLADSAGEAQTLNNIGQVYQSQKQWREAVEAYRDAVRVTEQLRDNTREPLLQTSLLAQKTDPFFRLAQCLLKLQKPSEALAAGEGMKARGLVDILRDGKADVRRGMSDDERKQEQALQERLTTLGVQLEDLRRHKADAAVEAALVSDLEKARQDFESFRRDLYLHRPDLATRRAEVAPATLDDLGGSLFADRLGLVVLSYLVGEKETLLFVLTAPEKSGGPARLTVHRIDVTLKDLADAVDACCLACRDPGTAPVSEALYRWLITPAADELANAKQVVIVPDGVLHILPFQALRADSEDNYLIERFPLSYAPSVTALVKMEALGAARRKQYAGKPATLLAVGLSDFRGREEESRPLAAAEPEAKAVAGLFGAGGRTLLAADATRAKVEAAWGACRYLHFATHGRFNSNAALYSSLILHADAGGEGVLYARDLLDADAPAELAVMSACETGLGERVSGEGVLGLSWSWFAAGVPSTVASQWLVGDGSTARLMTAFYGRLKAGDSKAEALRQAELTLLKEDATKNPFYWAPFVLVGDDK